jgi:hypothetical protein
VNPSEPRPGAEDNPAPGSPAAGTPDASQAPQTPERRWVWMDRWDPGTWEMPSNPTKLQRVLAGIALIIVFVMTVYVPFRMLGVF